MLHLFGSMTSYPNTLYTSSCLSLSLNIYLYLFILFFHFFSILQSLQANRWYFMFFLIFFFPFSSKIRWTSIEACNSKEFILFTVWPCKSTKKVSPNWKHRASLVASVQDATTMRCVCRIDYVLVAAQTSKYYLFIYLFFLI